MKILITILLVLIGFAGLSQNNPPIVPRSSPAITVEDARWKGGLNMIGVRTHGLTLNGGLDSVASLIYEDSSGHWWFRDTLKIAPFGHVWSEFLKSGDATNILLQNQGANLGVINTLNIGSGLNATFLNGVGTVTVNRDTIWTLLPLFTRNLDTIGIYNVDTVGGVTGNDGYISAVQYTTLVHKQNPLQWQTQGINVGGLGQITTINLGINMTGTLFGNTLNIDVLAPPAFQKAIAWRNDSTLFAGVGAIDTVQLDSGLIGSVSHGTLDIKVQKDTIFNRNLLTTAGTDTSDFGGAGAKAFFNTYANMRNTYSMTWDSLSAGFYMKLLGHKSSIAGTDSVLIRDNTGSVLVVPKSAVGAITGATNGLSVFGTSIGLNGTYTQNNTETQSTFSQTFSGTPSTNLIVVNSGTGSGMSITTQSGDGLDITTNKSNAFGITITTDTAIAIQTTATAQNGSISINTIGVAGFSGDAFGSEYDVYASSNNSIDIGELINRHNLSGTARNQSGMQNDFGLPDNLGSAHTAILLRSLITDSAQATFTSEYHIGLSKSGTDPSLTSGALDQFIFKGSGQAQFTQYTPSNFVTSDTTNDKPLVVDASGNINRAANWSLGGGGGGSLTRQNITSGTSATVTGGNYLVQFNFGSVAATYTLTMPAAPTDQQIVEIQTGTTIAFGSPEITSLTLSPNAGQTINATTVFTLNDGNVYVFRYNTSGTFWDLISSH